MGVVGTVTTSTTSDQLQSAANGLTVTYDAAGNVSKVNSGAGKPSYAYCWDEVGHLSSAARYSATGVMDVWAAAYDYDDVGNRVFDDYVNLTGTETSAAIGTHWQVFNSMRLEHASIISGAWQDDASLEHLYLGGGAAHVFWGAPTLPQATTSTNGLVHMHLRLSDTLGSTSFVVDHDTGEVVERTTYQPYGAPDTDYRPARWGSFREDLKFNGQLDDAAVGLVNLGARFYSPMLNRFISPDPLTVHGVAGDPNPYAYADGNPIAFSDPSGLTVHCLTSTDEDANTSILGCTDDGDQAQQAAQAAAIAAAAEAPAEAAPAAAAADVALPMAEGAGLLAAGIAGDVLVGGMAYAGYQQLFSGTPTDEGDCEGGPQCATAEGSGGPTSPTIDPNDIAGKSPAEIDKIAKGAGLIPKGPDPAGGAGSYVDPVTGEQRILIHPEPASGDPHAHVNDPSGNRLGVNGQVVPLDSPDAHLPINYP